MVNRGKKWEDFVNREEERFHRGKKRFHCGEVRKVCEDFVNRRNNYFIVGKSRDEKDEDVITSPKGELEAKCRNPQFTHGKLQHQSIQLCA